MNIKYDIDVPSIATAILNTINPDKLIAKASEFFLDEQQRKKDFLPAVFLIIEQHPNNSEHLDLLATIYMKKTLEKSYKYVII